MKKHFNNAGQANPCPDDAEKMGQQLLRELARRDKMNVSLVKKLIKAGADLTQRNDDNDTPLTAAAWAKREDVVRMMVERGADVNASNVAGNTALIWAAAQGQTQMVAYLLSHHADPMPCDCSGNSALMNAWMLERYAVIPLLEKAEDEVKAFRAKVERAKEQATITTVAVKKPSSLKMKQRRK